MPGPTDAARRTLTHDLKREAARLGFDACGVARAERLDDEARRLEAWLRDGRHAGMGYMERHFDKRVDPRQLVPGAQSVVSVLHSYHTGDAPSDDPRIGKVSRYADGDDYHDILKEKLFELFDWLDRRTAGAGGRAFVDSAPVMDKAWAQRAGLGWIGKNSNLLTRSLGSYIFIGELIVEVDLTPDAPFAADHCGSCTRCLDACPTNAIHEPYSVDASRCISYWTIEHRGDEIPENLAKDFGTWIFGCDICQEVCPWTKFSQRTTDARLLPREGIHDTPLDVWEELDLDAFREQFRHSPIRRAGLDGMRRNVRAVQGTQPP